MSDVDGFPDEIIGIGDGTEPKQPALVVFRYDKRSYALTADGILPWAYVPITLLSREEYFSRQRDFPVVADIGKDREITAIQADNNGTKLPPCLLIQHNEKDVRGPVVFRHPLNDIGFVVALGLEITDVSLEEYNQYPESTVFRREHVELPGRQPDQKNIKCRWERQLAGQDPYGNPIYYDVYHCYKE